MYRFAPREYFGQLLGAHSWPMANPTRIKVYKGAAIVSNTTAMGLQPKCTQLGHADIGQEEIQSLAAGMLAVLGDVAATAAQHRVGAR